MKVLITRNDHRFYDKVGTIIDSGNFEASGKIYVVQLPDGKLTYVKDGEYKPVKRQDD
jgi:hypothetical protein